MLTSDENGQARGGASKIINPGEENISSGIEKVEIVTIDETVPADREVKIIQLDVEGYEKQALNGALKTIRRCLPIIVVEVLSDSRLLGSEWFAETILALGYEKTGSIHGNIVFVCK